MKQIKRKLILLLFIAHCSLQIAVAQQPTEEWVRIYNSSDNMADHFIDMVLDNNGNIYQTGWNLTQSQNNNIVTVKYNSLGVQQWGVSYNGDGNASDVARGMAVDSNGNCYVAGYSGFNFGPYDGILIKYNSFGDTLWTRKLITNLDDEFTNIAVSQNNFVYVTGRSGDTAVIFKYDSTGILLWRNQYFESTYLTLSGIIKLDKFNNIYIGSTKHILSNPFSADFLVRKYTKAGSLMWATSYGNPANVADWMNGFVLDNLGNSYATGYTEINGRDIITVKLNSGGILQWARFHNGEANTFDQGNALTCDTSGNNIFVTGLTTKTVTERDYVTINYNSIGDTLWMRTYNGPGNYSDKAFDVTLDNQLNVYITGESSTNSFDFDVATLKYSLDGNQQWVTRWNTMGSGGDRGIKIKVDNQFNVYVGGEAAAPGPNVLDLLAIKYSQTVGINTISTNIPTMVKLEQNYPNPFNPVTNIRFMIKDYGRVSLVVYNLLGKKLETLIDQNLSPGEFEYRWNAEPYASGIYFYVLETGSIIETKKMMFLK